MFPVSGAWQLKHSDPNNEFPIISASSAYSKLERFDTLGRNRFHKPCCLASARSFVMTSKFVHLSALLWAAESTCAERIEWNNVSLVVDVGQYNFAHFIASMLVFIKASSLR